MRGESVELARLKHGDGPFRIREEDPTLFVRQFHPRVLDIGRHRGERERGATQRLLRPIAIRSDPDAYYALLRRSAAQVFDARPTRVAFLRDLGRQAYWVKKQILSRDFIRLERVFHQQTETNCLAKRESSSCTFTWRTTRSRFVKSTRQITGGIPFPSSSPDNASRKPSSQKHIHPSKRKLSPSRVDFLRRRI